MYWLLVGVFLFQLSNGVVGQNCTKNNDTIYADANCRALWEGVVEPITIDATDMKPIHHACQDHRCTINIHNFISNCIHDSTVKFDMQTLVSLACTFDDEGETCLYNYPEATATLDKILAFDSCDTTKNCTQGNECYKQLYMASDSYGRCFLPDAKAYNNIMKDPKLGCEVLQTAYKKCDLTPPGSCQLLIDEKP
ncbi:uncharacterized protein [Dysidea avara]|uniref:uncharacterized protein n=1 Tax=Dysidea avara TaxID=196820 RepID=UPI0033240BD8